MCCTLVGITTRAEGPSIAISILVPPRVREQRLFSVLSGGASRALGVPFVLISTDHLLPVYEQNEIYRRRGSTPVSRMHIKAVLHFGMYTNTLHTTV